MEFVSKIAVYGPLIIWAASIPVQVFGVLWIRRRMAERRASREGGEGG